MKSTLAQLVEIEHKLAIRRTLVLGITMWMTWRATDWAMWFSVGNDRPGLEIAAIVAAVTAPVAAIINSVFKTYVEGKVL